MSSSVTTPLYNEPVSGNSLDKFLRSIEGYTANQGQQLQVGGGQTMQSGLNDLGPALDILTKLTKGDQADVNQALGPQYQSIDEQMGAIRSMISQQPRGGGKTTALAEAPFKAASEKQNLATQARTAATGQLAQLGTEVAGLGERALGLGIGETEASANMALTKQGLDYGTNFASQFQAIAQGLNALI